MNVIADGVKDPYSYMVIGQIVRESLERFLGFDVHAHVQYGRWIRKLFM